jgi:hypothetical protein
MQKRRHVEYSRVADSCEQRQVLSQVQSESCIAVMFRVDESELPASMREISQAALLR